MSALLLVLIVVFMLVQSLPALQAVGPARFATDAGWHPQAGALAGRFNLLPMITATAFSATGAALLAAPLGLLMAVCLTEYAPAPIARPLHGLMELTAGVPSVVFGLWGLVTLVPLIACWKPPGASLLAGILILFLMILPTMVLASVAALRALPVELRQAAAGLGFTQAGMLWSVLIPAARGGLWGALVLSLARAVGETMAVLMVTGNVVRMPASVFDPVRTLTANIALELAYAMDVHRSALFVGGLILAMMVAMLVLLAERAAAGHA